MLDRGQLRLVLVCPLERIYPRSLLSKGLNEQGCYSPITPHDLHYFFSVDCINCTKPFNFTDESDLCCDVCIMG